MSEQPIPLTDTERDLVALLAQHDGVSSTAGWAGSPDPKAPKNIRRVCKCGEVIGWHDRAYGTGWSPMSGYPFDPPHARHVVTVLAERDRRGRAAALAPIRRLIAHLDRCEHGRHEGEYCLGCKGPSHGNPHDVMGYALAQVITVADFRAALAAAGVDAAPNEPDWAEVDAEGGRAFRHWVATEVQPAPNETTTEDEAPAYRCFDLDCELEHDPKKTPCSRAAVPSGHEQEGDHR